MAAPHYLDSSVLLKFYLEEPGSAVVHALFAQGTPLYLSSLNAVEFHAACARLLREGAMTAHAHTRITESFSSQLAEMLYQVHPPTPAWFDRARAILGDIGRTHPLRSLDALHLAAALMIRESEPDLTLVSSDARLLVAARAAGLEALNPVAG